MKRPHLPRTLLGAGGVRLIDMPGVIYPASVLHDPPAPGTHRTNPLPSPPADYISTRQVADTLSISPRSARAMLTRRKTPRVVVRAPGQSVTSHYWSRKALQDIINERNPLVTSLPERLCCSTEACHILMVSRSTLHRYVQRGLLVEHHVRHASATGIHHETLYRRGQVHALADQIRAARARAEAARRARITRLWEEHQTRRE